MYFKMRIKSNEKLQSSIEESEQNDVGQVVAVLAVTIVHRGI